MGTARSPLPKRSENHSSLLPSVGAFAVGPSEQLPRRTGCFSSEKTRIGMFQKPHAVYSLNAFHLQPKKIPGIQSPLALVRASFIWRVLCGRGRSSSSRQQHNRPSHLPRRRPRPHPRACLPACIRRRAAAAAAAAAPSTVAQCAPHMQILRGRGARN